jgi:hypothetical protein
VSPPPRSPPPQRPPSPDNPPSAEDAAAAFAAEADVFVRVLADLAPDLRLDFSLASIDGVEAFVARSFDPPGSQEIPQSLEMGVGCYLGEALRRSLGGRWSAEGHLEDVGAVVETFPLQRAQKRFREGPDLSLAAFAASVAEAAARRPPAPPT